MNIWMFPKYSETNKYNILLSDSLEKEGLNVNNFRQRNLFKMKKGDILHFHWIHSLYQSKYKILFFLKSIILILALIIIKKRGVKVVWTVHNLYPHSYRFKKLEFWIRKKVIEQCDLLIVAATSLKEEVASEFRILSEKIEVIPHGHYQSAYPILGVDMRQKYNISKTSYVYLFLGAIKPYKGVNDLVNIFLKLAKRSKENTITLLIAGNASETSKQTLKQKNQHPNIHMDLRFIPDEEIVDIITAADAVVLPYKEITTSGSAILALSFYKPIVAPRTPFLEEYFHSNNSILYDHTEEEALLNAMEEVKSLSENIKDEEFMKSIQKLDWSNIAKTMLLQYKKILKYKA